MPLRDGMPRWPDDPEVRIHAEEYGGCRVTLLAMSAHTGTHVDAPLHYFPGGRPVDDLAIDATVGRARVVAAPGGGAVGERQARECRPQRGERLLFKAGGRASLTAEAARVLAEAGIRAAGVDSLSVGDETVHRILLEAGVVIIEALDLGAVDPGEYDLICLPLRIAGADGAPARAILRKRA